MSHYTARQGMDGDKSPSAEHEVPVTVVAAAAVYAD